MVKEILKLYHYIQPNIAQDYLRDNPLNGLKFTIIDNSKTEGEFSKMIKVTKDNKLVNFPLIYEEDHINVNYNTTNNITKIYNQYIKIRLVNGILHNLAIKEQSGRKYYFENGLLHRTDGPAIEGNFLECWYNKGLLHRDANDGPALSLFREMILYAENNKLVDGVSMIIGNIRYITKNNKLHAEDGPAVYSDNVQIYMRNGIIHNDRGPAAKIYNTAYYFKNGMIHNDSGPAIFNNKIKMWFQYGSLHRDDGPAYLTQKCEKWYHRGSLHRIEGPAVITNSYEHFYHFGVKVRSTYGNNCEISKF